MSDFAVNTERVLNLAAAVCDHDASRNDLIELDAILLADKTSRRRYLRYCRMHAALEMELQAGWELKRLHRRNDLDSAVLAPWESEVLSNAISPAVSVPSYPTVGFLSTTYNGIAGYIPEGAPLACLVATIVLAVGLFVASLVYVSHPAQVAGQRPGVIRNGLTHAPKREFVGQITGMVDCRWDDPSKEPTSGQVALGEKFILSSGLMEITYGTGAKIILQGPATYEVKSKNGGFLSIGKLTGMVEVQTAKGFFVRTPTVKITDLGTEFGVEVGKQGTTLSHVFRGSVQVQLIEANAVKEDDSIVLRANESACIEKVEGRNGARLNMRRVSLNPKTFVRQVGATLKSLDLLDIVAGGNGTGHRRERGIDPTTGMEDPLFVPSQRDFDWKYRPVTWHKLIDGVFIARGGAGPVVVDSAGHTFDGFARTTLQQPFGSIWARAADVKAPRLRGQEKKSEYWIYVMGRGQQFMPNNSGLLGLVSNVGITFNLEAMRTMYPAVRPARFRATAGVADAHGTTPPGTVQLVDIWVLVDGRLKLNRTNLRPQDGPVKVDIALGPRDRFLTLVTTDTGNDRNFDWMVYGDPVLEMVSVDDPEAAADRKEMP